MKVCLYDEGNTNYINNSNENNIENNNKNNIENNNNNENYNENNIKNNNNQINENNENKQSNESNENMAMNADQLLEKLKLEMPEDAYCLFGIIDNDLYTETLSSNGKRIIKSTYGKRSIPDRVSIFSLARFDPFFNFNRKINKFIKRAKI